MRLIQNHYLNSWYFDKARKKVWNRGPLGIELPLSVGDRDAGAPL